MSNTPEWVEPGDEPEPAPPPSEREQLVKDVQVALGNMKIDVQELAAKLLRLDEIGAPVSRSRTRVTKLEEARDDLSRHFVYDVVQGNTKGTKDQQARAERYELS